MAEEETTTTDTPPEGESTGTETPPTPAVPVEPKLGWNAFVQMQHLRPASAAGFRLWMRMNAHNPDGHYDRATWAQWLQEALAHEVTT